MSNHEKAQREHYKRQYESLGIAENYDPDEDLWDWAKWYPLLVMEKFLPTISGKSMVATCCGAGRELGLLGKHGVDITATDLTVDHLWPLIEKGVITAVEEQNAERLSYPDDSFDYGFVNAGLHHLQHPHAGLCELMRTSREAAIFIESQDSVLHTFGKLMGRNADFEPSGNYVYRWSFREIEKIGLSAHAHSIAVKTYFLPILMRMRGVTGSRKEHWVKVFKYANRLVSAFGNLLISMVFKRPPTSDQEMFLLENQFRYKVRDKIYLDYVAKQY